MTVFLYLTINLLAVLVLIYNTADLSPRAWRRPGQDLYYSSSSCSWPL